MDNLSQREIRGYELRECIGEGGFGAVYRAFQPSVGREVAIKVILPEFANHPDFIRSFEVEAQLIARLEHPHIVPLYDYWRDPDGAYLVMRWLHGSLRSAIQRGPWTVEATANLLEQMAAALTVAHREEIIHRDIKPDNILLDEDNNAYLADFGIAKNLSINNTNDEDAVIGSPAYLTPEQIKGEQITAKTDIYTLGLVVYEMLVSEKPFTDVTTPYEWMDRHLTTPIPPIQTRRPNLPVALNEVLQTATAKDPTQRYANVIRFATAFRAAIPSIQRGPAQPLPEPLTGRELDILSLMTDGLSNQEIAQKLYLSAGTVKWYVQQIYAKLDVHSRYQAIERARQLQLINKSTAPVQGTVVDTPPNNFAVQVVSTTATNSSIAALELVNPYKGLHAFQEADTDDFFGRATLTEQLLSRMTDDSVDSRFLAIVGPSGSGKSSVVRAGLIPALRRGALPTSSQWFITEMMPGTHPLEELEAALLRVAVGGVPELLRQLTQDRRGLVRAVKRILPADPAVELLLVIDQFEELFTLVQDENIRNHFVDNLLSAVTDSRSRVRVIVTLRADFYDRPLHYPRFAELMRRHTEIIVPMTQDELEHAVNGPAERIGLVVEPSLIATIVNEVARQPGSLPLMQYALTELFDGRQGQKLTLNAYRESGGISGALARRADEIYTDLDSERQAVARQLFLRLITLGEGTEDTRRRVPQSELASLSHQPGLVEEVLDAFQHYRLLTLDRDPLTRTPTVEVAHEALLRTWTRLREWLSDSREELRLQRRMTIAVNEWLAAGKETSFLATGARLDQFHIWSQTTSLKLNEHETAYLYASLAERDSRLAQDELRKKQQYQLERRAANNLRILVGVLVVFTLLATLLSIFAFDRSEKAFTAEGKALSSAATSAASLLRYEQAESLRLSDQADHIYKSDNKNPELVALLNIRALKTAYNSTAENTLTQVLEEIDTQQIFAGHSLNVTAVAVSNDSKYILTGSSDKSVRLWDLQTGQELHQFTGHTDSVTSVAFSPDSKTVLSAGLDAVVRLWDLQTGQELRQFTGHTDSITSLTISSDGKYLLTGSIDKTARLWDMRAGQELRQFTGHTDAVSSVAISSDDKTVLTGSNDQTTRLWDLQTGKELHAFTNSANPGVVFKVAFMPDGKAVMSSDAHNAILWDTQTYEPLATFSFPDGLMNTAALSPNGKLLMLASTDGAAWLFNAKSKRKTRYFTGHFKAITSIAFSNDGKYIVTGSSDKTARLWSIESRPALRTLDGGFPPTVTSAALGMVGSNRLILSPDGHYTAVKSAALEQILAANLTVQALSPDQKLVLVTESVSGKSKVADLWNLETDQKILSLPVDGQVVSGGFTPDGRYVITTLRNMARLWDVQTGQEVRQLEGYAAMLNAGQFYGGIAFSPDSKFVAVINGENVVPVWDVQTGKQLIVLKGHSATIHSVAFSPDGSYIATTSYDHTARLWDSHTGQEIRQFTGHPGIVSGVVFSPDGKYLLTGSNDSTTRLWDVTTGQEVRRFNSRPGIVEVAFSPDGNYLVVKDGAGSWFQGTLHIWDMDYHDFITFACQHVFRDFTDEERIQYGIPDKTATCEQFGSPTVVR